MIRPLFFTLALSALALLTDPAFGFDFTLKDGTVHKGEPALGANEKGIIIRSESGTYGTRIEWNRFTQDSLKEFAKNPRIAKFIETLLDAPPAGEGDKEETVTISDKAKKALPVVRDYPKPDRNAPQFGFMSGFSTGIGIVMLLILYAGNIYAGHEIAIFRRRPRPLVCGVAAALPVVGPLLFLCLPSIPEKPINQMIVEEAPPAAPTPTAHGAPKKGLGKSPPAAHGATAQAAAAEQAEAPAEAEAAEAAAPPPPPAAKLPSYKRGEFTINRRFIETKLSSFLKVVPSEAEKGLVCVMKTARGEFVGRRITKITPADITLAIGDENAYYDQLITYNDILEIEIRHKEPTA